MLPNIKKLWDISGQTAIVTGAGRGIGRCVANLFAAAGAKVIVADVIGESALDVVQEILAGDHEAHAVQVDIAEEASVKALYETSRQKYGMAQILVHCAAIFPKYALLDIEAEQWDRIQAVNTRGTMFVMREAIKQMRAGGRGGAIVNISSVSGEREVVYHNAAYGASKAATTNLTRVAALEFGVDGIRVNAVLPGGTATEGAREAGEAMRARGLELKGPMTQPGRVPLGNMGTPDDIANACLFLAGPGAKFITGQCLAVDGGFLIS